MDAKQFQTLVDKLEEIRCGIIDVETAVEKANEPIIQGIDDDEYVTSSDIIAAHKESLLQKVVQPKVCGYGFIMGDDICGGECSHGSAVYLSCLDTKENVTIRKDSVDKPKICKWGFTYDDNDPCRDDVFCLATSSAFDKCKNTKDLIEPPNEDRGSMKPCDCKDNEDIKKLTHQTLKFNNDSITVRPNVVILRIGRCKLTISQRLFEKFALWYFEEQGND